MTDSSLLQIAFWLALFVIFYGLISRGMFRATEPLRYEMLEIAAELLNSENVSDAQKRRIESALSTIHSSLTAWKITFSAVCLIVTIPIHHLKPPIADKGIPNNLRIPFQNLQIRWLIATISNSPAAAFIFVLLTTLLMAFALSVRTLSAMLMTQHDHHDSDDVVRA